MAQSSYPARIRLFDYMKKPAGPGLYVHFPFCLSICKYCDFPRVKFDPSLVDSYLDFLDRAFAMVPDEYRSRPFGSVYVGGRYAKYCSCEVLGLPEGLCGVTADGAGV